MLKKLKIKFIFTNVLLITIVILLCFAAIHFFAKKNIEEESIQALQSFVIISDMEGEKQGAINKPFENKSDGKADFPYFEEAIINKSSHLSVFCVKLNRDNELVAVYEYKENLTLENKDILEGFSESALREYKSSGETGILKEHNLRYHVTKTDRHTYISFLDMTSEQEDVLALVRGFYIVMLASWLVVVAVSFVLASISIRPVEKAWEKQKQFVADASHELKTPLTVILASTDVMLSEGEKVSPEQRKWLECTKSEAERMKELLSGMLYLARSDDELSRLNKIPHHVFDLSELLAESLLNFEIQCFEKGKTLVSNVEENIFIKGNETEIKQFVGIFLDNACKYSDENGTITVNLSSNGGKCVLSFKNTGTPIPQKDIPHIFERFYRSGESRAREEGGYGLGLSIAHAIAASHGTKISLISGEGGTEFSVKFPKEQK